jgi:hypothetical protein
MQAYKAENDYQASQVYEASFQSGLNAMAVALQYDTVDSPQQIGDENIFDYGWDDNRGWWY